MNKLHLKDCSYTRKGVKYPYFGIAQSNKEGGKNQKKIIAYVGKLTDEEAENYRTFLRAINKELPKTKFFADIRELLYEEQKRYFDVLIMNELWKDLKFDKLFSKKLTNNQKLSTENVARILTINKLLDPTSKSGTIAWLKGTLLPTIIDIDQKDYNKDKIFRELTHIHNQKEKIESHLIEFSRKNFKESNTTDDCEVYYIDGTTSWFEGSKCPLSEYAKEKTRGYHPQVVGFVLVTDKEGYPIAWEVIPGKTKDSTTLKEIAERIYEKYKVSEVTYCFDRGVASTSNFDTIEGLESKFISGIKDNQIKNIFDLTLFSNKTRSDLISYCELPPEEKRGKIPINGFYTAGNNRFYNDLGVVNNKRYIVSFYRDIFKLEQKEREDAIERALLSVDKLNSDLKEARKKREFNHVEQELLELLKKNKVTTFISYTIIPVVSKHESQSYEIKLSLKKPAIDESAKTDGMMVYITDHIEKSENSSYFKISAYDILRHYSEKYVVEDAFKLMKSFLDLHPMYVWTEDHVKAHFDITVMGHFIDNYIYRKLAVSRKSFGDYLKSLTKKHYNEVAKIEAYAKTKNIHLKKLFDKQRTKILIESLDEAYALSQDLHNKLIEYTRAISLREFYTCIKDQSAVIKLAAPNGVTLYKHKKMEEGFKYILKKLKLDRIVSPQLHKAHNIFQ